MFELTSAAISSSGVAVGSRWLYVPTHGGNDVDIKYGSFGKDILLTYVTLPETRSEGACDHGNAGLDSGWPALRAPVSMG